MMFIMSFVAVPEIAGISLLQRNPKSIFQKIKNKKTVFITERGNPSAVLLDINIYKDLVDSAQMMEDEKIKKIVLKGSKEAVEEKQLEDFDALFKD